MQSLDTTIKLLATEYIIDATSYEMLSLWQENHDRISWEQVPTGAVVTIAELNDELININCTWAWINDHLVMFFYCCSNLCRLDFIDDYFKRNCPSAKRINAMNFHIARKYCETAPKTTLRADGIRVI